MNILVTGGHGFVGSALVQSLLRKYPDKMILAPSSKELDLFHYEDIRRFLEMNQVDCIFHLAAKLGGVGIVSNRPLEFLESNLLINYNMVHAALEMGVSKFITLGSSCCYSVDAPLPNKEAYLWKGHPENTYGICKLVLLEHLMNQSTMDWTYLIPPNIYGPGDHFGEADAHFIPATVLKFQKAYQDGCGEIEVWGDGTQTRDFLYIDDLIHFLMLAMEDERFSRKPLNIGTGIEISVKEVVEDIREAMGASEKIRIRWAPDKPTGIKRKALCNEELMKLEPDFAFLEMREGLARTLKNIRLAGE